MRKTVLAFSNNRIYIMQRDDPMSTPIPRLTNYEDVEIMIVARPLRQLFLARERERDPAFRPVYTESASAPGVEEPEVRDPASLMGVKSTNSPDRVEVTQTPPRSGRRDRRVYSPITTWRPRSQANVFLGAGSSWALKFASGMACPQRICSWALLCLHRLLRNCSWGQF